MLPRPEKARAETSDAHELHEESASVSISPDPEPGRRAFASPDWAMQLVPSTAAAPVDDSAWVRRTALRFTHLGFTHLGFSHVAISAPVADGAREMALVDVVQASQRLNEAL
jgi:hypothetical protein